MSIIVIGIDLAKSVFAVHGINQEGKAELVKPRVSREQLLPLIAQLPPCRIGMEACSGAHHWASLSEILCVRGHEMIPKGKHHDCNDDHDQEGQGNPPAN